MSFPTVKDAPSNYVGPMAPGDGDKVTTLERPAVEELQKYRASINQQKLKASQTNKNSALNIRNEVQPQGKSSLRSKLENLKSASLSMGEGGTRKKGGRRNRRKKKNAKSQKKKSKKRKSRSRKH